MPETIGIKQRIREAKNRSEVEALMIEGHTYVYASGHTRRQWLRISREKLKAFEQEKTDAKKKSDK